MDILIFLYILTTLKSAALKIFGKFLNTSVHLVKCLYVKSSHIIILFFYEPQTSFYHISIIFHSY